MSSGAVGGGGNSSDGVGTTGSESNSAGGGGSAQQCPELAHESDCGDTEFSDLIAPNAALFVVEKSSSMLDAYENEWKWVTLSEAFRLGLGIFAERRVDLGLQLFPSSNAPDEQIPLEGCVPAGNCCELSDEPEPTIPIGSGTIGGIVETVLNTQPGGGAPAAAALSRALDYLLDGTLEAYPRVSVVLFLDGAPNCNPNLECDEPDCFEGVCWQGLPERCVDSEATLSAIEALRNAGISTHVVGLPYSAEFADVLDAFAAAGADPASSAISSYHPVATQGDLLDLFYDLAIELGSPCELELTQPQAEPPLVALDCEPIPRLGQGGVSGAPGLETWRLESPDGNRITLLGELCERALALDRVNVFPGCETR